MREPASDLLTHFHHEEYIQYLQHQFNEIKNFRERLEFFDHHFGLLPYPFPRFQPELNIFFDSEGLNELNKLFDKERRHSFIAERKFNFEGREYLFRIIPFNTYPQIQNDYILSKFLTTDKNFGSSVSEAAFLRASNQSNFLQKKQQTENILANIRQLLDNGTEQSFRSRFMTVFFAGYTDQATNMVKKFRNKKKYIELYLYAQGILFRKYQDALEDLSEKY